MDRVEEIRERHKAISGSVFLASGKSNYALSLAINNLQIAHNDRHELLSELDKARAERDRYRDALTRIANTDYRGNRSGESPIAWAALQDAASDD